MRLINVSTPLETNGTATIGLSAAGLNPDTKRFTFALAQADSPSIPYSKTRSVNTLMRGTDIRVQVKDDGTALPAGTRVSITLLVESEDFTVDR